MTAGERKRKRQKLASVEAQEIELLNQRVQEFAPAEGYNPLSQESTSHASSRSFAELPISSRTKEGLQESGYVTLTAIQRAALPHTLCGRDVLGAAKTGSGKTLAFLLAVVERLYRLRWTLYDGLGALILTPTRELAVQIFEELRKLGKNHDLSAGLLIGGKNVKEEKERINRMNILICTPGRLLQHMDETVGFHANQLQVLVLDEADRLLDVGFAATLDAIIADLPPSRQTLLFSATQTKRVRDLARLSLDKPEYLAVHADATEPTPLKLQQFYMAADLSMKVDLLWSFLKSHTRSKMIIFLSTCKQVRFIHESFRKLRPGIPLVCLHGNMKQMKRMSVYQSFCRANSVAMFATDIASRGLDFSSVDWVFQADCPENVEQYIHRVGRTARFVSGGNALLLLASSEQNGMLEALRKAQIPIKELSVNPEKIQKVSSALQALLSKDAKLKVYGQRAIVAYMRCVYVQPLKDIFDVNQLPVAEFAESMGLSASPQLRFIKRNKRKSRDKNLGPQQDEDEDEDELSDEIDRNITDQTGSRVPENPHVVKPHSARLPEDNELMRQSVQKASTNREGRAENMQDFDRNDSHDSEDHFLTVKQSDVFNVMDESEESESFVQKSRADAARIKLPKKIKVKSDMMSGRRVVFDDLGKPVAPFALTSEEIGYSGEHKGENGSTNAAEFGVRSRSSRERFQLAALIMQSRDAQDKRLFKAARKEKRAMVRLKAKANAEQIGQVTLPGSDTEQEDCEGIFGLKENGVKKLHHVLGRDGDNVETLPEQYQSSGKGSLYTSSPHKMARRNVQGHSGKPITDFQRTSSIAEQENVALRLLRSK